MKNLFKNLMLVAVAAMGFTACEQVGVESVAPVVPEVKMTVIAGMDETRTYIDEDSKKVMWSENDQLKVIEKSATGGISYATTSSIAIENDKAKFGVSFTKNTTDSEFTYNAFYPATAVAEDDTAKRDITKVKVIVKDQQNATATSFDPAADVLVAKQLEFDAQPTELNMQFKRLVSLGKLTLKNLPADAKIEKVVFTAADGKVLAGRNYVDATTGEVSQYGYYGATNAITINYTESISTRDIYFTCNPFEMEAGETFKVQAFCGDKSYTRDVVIPAGRSLKFTEGNLGTFSVDMASATVETISAFAEGQYAVIAMNGSKYYAMKGVKGSGNFMTYSEVTYDGTATTFTTEDDTLVWNIKAVEGGYTIQNYDGKYLYGSSSGNYAYLGDSQTLTITPVNGTTQQYNISIKTIAERILAFNTNSGQERFAFYKGTQANNLFLVPVAEDTTPRFTVDPKEYAFTNEGGIVTFTATPNAYLTTTISATEDADWLTVTPNGNTFTVEAGENDGAAREATITFYADGAENVVVTVSQAGEGEVPGGRDDFNTVDTNTSYGTRTSTAGWKGTNCAVMQGGSSDSNPTFKFIGENNSTRAFTINGKTTAKGTITSPTLTTGCGKLSLNYGIAFSESNGVDFTVTIKQNGAEDLTYQIDVNTITQKKAYTWEQEVNVAGDFVIEITNNCPSNNSSSNKDRVSIWDIAWTGYNN